MLPLQTELDKETRELIEPLLPCAAQDFVRVIGLESALSLFGEFGGTEYRFVKKDSRLAAHRTEDLAAVVGMENAARLVDIYNGCEIYIPRCQRAIAALRARMIVADFDEMTRTQSVRETCNQLARRYRMSNRSVEKIANSSGFKPTTKQP